MTEKNTIGKGGPRCYRVVLMIMLDGFEYRKGALSYVSLGRAGWSVKSWQLAPVSSVTESEDPTGFQVGVGETRLYEEACL